MDTKKLLDLGIKDIQEYQQNRYPCLLIDGISEVVPGKYAKGYKNFTYNEWYFPAHFEDDPTVPGFVQFEAMAQVFLMTFLTIGKYKGMQTGEVSVDKVEFKRKIVPGERLELKALLNSFRHGLARGEVEGYVNNELACKAQYVIAIIDLIKGLSPKSANRK